MTSTPVRVADPRELVALAAHVLGFRPTQSLVAISLREHGRTGVIARVDLAAAGDPRLLAAVAEHLRADGARAAVVLAHSEDGDGAGGLPHRESVQRLAEELARCAVDPVHSWLVGGGVLRSYTCTGACCPPEGLALAEGGTQVAAEMVIAGSAVMSDQGAWRAGLLAAVVPLPAACRSEVERAARAPLGPGEARGLLHWWCDALAAATAAAEAGPGLQEAVESLLAPAAAGRLLAGLADRRLRDALLLTLVPGAGGGAEELVDGIEGPLARAAMKGVFGGAVAGGGPAGAASGPRAVPAPDPDVVRAAAELLRALVRRASPHRRADPLAVLAWAGWWQGAGPEAAVHADLALRAEPDHALASLVLQSVDRGIPPAWARSAR